MMTRQILSPIRNDGSTKGRIRAAVNRIVISGSDRTPSINRPVTTATTGSSDRRKSASVMAIGIPISMPAA